MPRAASPEPQGCGEGEAGARERGEEPAPARGPERGRLLGGETEVAAAARGGQLGGGGRDQAQVMVEGGARGAGGDEGGRGLELGAGGVARGIGGDEDPVVGGVVGGGGGGIGGVRHVSPLTTIGPAGSAVSSRTADRPANLSSTSRIRHAARPRDATGRPGSPATASPWRPCPRGRRRWRLRAGRS